MDGVSKIGKHTVALPRPDLKGDKGFEVDKRMGQVARGVIACPSPPLTKHEIRPETPPYSDVDAESITPLQEGGGSAEGLPRPMTPPAEDGPKWNPLEEDQEAEEIFGEEPATTADNGTLEIKAFREGRSLESLLEDVKELPKVFKHPCNYVFSKGKGLRKASRIEYITNVFRKVFGWHSFKGISEKVFSQASGDYDQPIKQQFMRSLSKEDYPMLDQMMEFGGKSQSIAEEIYNQFPDEKAFQNELHFLQNDKPPTSEEIQSVKNAPCDGIEDARKVFENIQLSENPNTAALSKSYVDDRVKRSTGIFVLNGKEDDLKTLIEFVHNDLDSDESWRPALEQVLTQEAFMGFSALSRPESEIKRECTVFMKKNKQGQVDVELSFPVLVKKSRFSSDGADLYAHKHYVLENNEGKISLINFEAYITEKPN